MQGLVDQGLPGGTIVENPLTDARETGDGWISGLGRSSGVENGHLLQYSCLENPHGQRSLAGYSPWGHKESTMKET